MDKYIAALADPKKREPDIYQQFKDICDNIIDRLSELEHSPDQLNHRIGPWHSKGDAQLVDGAKRSPATEPQLIQEILAAAPELKKHLPQIHFQRFYNSATDLRLPRFNFVIDSDDHQRTMEYRDLLVTVSRRCRGLDEVESLDEFKKVFIDIVESHHLTYMKGKVLHRDASEGNIMFYRDEEDIAVGLLSDFDNTSRVDEQGDIIGSSMKQRTGTVPFMALDILQNVETPVPHLYRHDLESFVYLLVWSGVHFDLKNGTCREFDPALECWDAKLSSEFGRAGSQKRDFWLTKDVTGSILDHFQPEFNPLKDHWIRPLRALFKKGFRLAEDAEGDNIDFEGKTLDGVVTFESFMHVLGQKPREWGSV